MIFGAALGGVDATERTAATLARHDRYLQVGTTQFDRRGFERVLVLGAGKAAAAMARAVEDRLRPLLDGGLVAIKPGHGLELDVVEQIEAGHPHADKGSVDAAERMLALAHAADQRTLVIGLWSGGASSLLEAPIETVTLDDLRATTELLLKSGLPIDRINALRCRLSRIKAGGLARALSPAQLVNLVISDVPDDRLELVGSGPAHHLVPTSATQLSDQLLAKFPMAVRVALRQPLSAQTTPHYPHTLVANNAMAIAAAERQALALGYRCRRGEPLSGEARTVGRRLAQQPLAPMEALICGGETTVRDDQFSWGQGGRNQELALAAAIALEHVERQVLLAGATDGNDGPTDAAGALVDGGTTERARRAGFEPTQQLSSHDAYPLLAASGDLLRIGPTRTNVADILILLRAA